MKIYIAKNRVRHGPYGLSELNAKVARGDFVATDSACFDGKNWVSTSDVPGIVIPTDHIQTLENNMENPVAGVLTSRFPKRKFSDEKSQTPIVRELLFTGTGSEFARIWIINLLLTVCTLGIYSAWAKVRSIHYFYGNTSLDGSSFSFVANPSPSLKGALLPLLCSEPILFFRR